MIGAWPKWLAAWREGYYVGVIDVFAFPEWPLLFIIFFGCGLTGLQFVLLAYVVVVLGGLGDMAGAMVGSLIVASVEVGGSYVFGAAWKEVLYFLLFIAVLVFRPAGLFGQRGAETLGVSRDCRRGGGRPCSSSAVPR